MSYSRARVVEANAHPCPITARAHGQLLPAPRLHGTLAVLGEIKKYLHEALSINPHRGQIFFLLPTTHDAVFFKAGLDHDTKLVKQRLYFYPGGLAGRLPKVHSRNSLECLYQRSQVLEILVVFQFAAARKVLMHDRDRPAHIAHFV